MITTLTFYLFAAVLVLSAVMVVTARNAVHSVLFLILCFFNAAGLFVLLGAEFIAMLMIIAYVGAVAVLFLFVVMMLDVSVLKSISIWRKYLPIGLAVAGVFLAELFIVFKAWQAHPHLGVFPLPMVDGVDNVEAIGSVLYTHYIYPFQLAGLVLLVAMIGAITLTMRTRGGIRRQNPFDQIKRKPSDAMEVVKVKTGEGVNV